jgi:membrane protease YdiL (CAAX protease family)
MSIIAEAAATAPAMAPATAPAVEPMGVLGQAVLAAICLGVAVPLTVRLVSRGTFAASDRLPPGGSAWPLVWALAWGLMVWVAVPVAYVQWRGPALRAGTPSTTAPTATPATAPTTAPTTRELSKPASPPDGSLDLATLPPRDVAFLAAVPHLAALVALVAFDFSIYGGVLSRLGFSRSQARQGLAAGAKLSVAFVPLVFGGAVLIDWFYKWIRYEHPREHDILRVLGESAEPIVRVALAAGAVLIAPLSEELLFRGHAQTILRAVFARLAGRAPPEPIRRGFPLDPPDAVPAIAPPEVPGKEAQVTPAWATWGAIVLASALFAAVHDPWTWPAIFLLSLCLGWAYERTGNLWVPVAIHAAFNAVSTLIFLLSAGAN